MEAFEKLRAAGKIKRWGVSNFDVDDMEELWSVDKRHKLRQPIRSSTISKTGRLNSISCDGCMRTMNLKLPTIVWLTLRLVTGADCSGTLRSRKIAERHGATTSQIALAWVLRQPEMIAIPKASNEKHVRENARSIEIKLTNEDFADLDREFPTPKSKKSLPML